MENSNQLVFLSSSDLVIDKNDYNFSLFTPMRRALMRAVQSITIAASTNCKCPTIWMTDIGYFHSRVRERYQILCLNSLENLLMSVAKSYWCQTKYCLKLKEMKQINWFIRSREVISFIWRLSYFMLYDMRNLVLYFEDTKIEI